MALFALETPGLELRPGPKHRFCLSLLMAQQPRVSTEVQINHLSCFLSGHYWVFYVEQYHIFLHLGLFLTCVRHFTNISPRRLVG